MNEFETDIKTDTENALKKAINKITILEAKNEVLKEQIEKMKVCSNCKHFNKVDDLEYCQNCERQLVNSLDKLPREEIIKDEWELAE